MSRMYGWSGDILRINLSDRKNTVENTSEYIPFTGGRGINVKIVYDQIGSELSPFDPQNLLCIGPGVLTGTPVPSSPRTEITAMSPRGLLDSASIGGFVGAEIRYAGFDNIIIQGKSEKPIYVYIHDKEIEYKDASQMWGKDAWETQQMIRHELQDQKVQALSIGPAGENLVSFACILTGKFQSAAGRCGLGAIMGSKNLKAVAVRGTGGIKIAQEQEFITECLNMQNVIRNPPFFDRMRNCGMDKDIYERYIDIGGKLVTGNWEGSDWKKDGFRRLVDDYEEFWKMYSDHQKHRASHQPGCFGCPIYHETYFNIPGDDINGTCKCVDWISMSGPVWTTDRKKVIEAVHLCNKYGLDVVSTGNIIAFLMELYQRGIITQKDTDNIAMKRGDIDAIISAIHKIGNQEGFGKVFRQGVLSGAKTIGRSSEKYAMQIKNLELYPEDGRSYKSMALLASVGKTEQFFMAEYEWAGAKNEMENLALEKYGRKDAAIPTVYSDKALSAWDSENIHCIGDMLGVCKFLIPWGFTVSMEIPARLFCLATGLDITEDDLLTAAQKVILLERSFNTLKGIRRKEERPPRRLFEKTVSDGLFKGEILHNEKFDTMLDEYYELRGCDKDGVPKEETFDQLNLSNEGQLFRKRMANLDSGN